MSRDTLTGSRIRERRSISGFRQAELAREVGISASYLNLIEHNRRRIGGKLLLQIAQVLGVEPSMLTEGAEAALIAALKEAAADVTPGRAETDRAEEFAGRFPGWAEVLAAAHRRIASLERSVETLSDRLTHDPHLAASVHELLSTAAAIRSTASILAETDELEPAWRDRFHRNLDQDSLRLADSSKALVAYLDNSETGEDRRAAPQEEAEAFLSEHGHHFPALESGTGDIAALTRPAADLTTGAARQIAGRMLKQYAADARALPLADFAAALAELGPDPMALAQRFQADLPKVFRRIAAMPAEQGMGEVGLVITDAAGGILFRKPVTGFPIVRFGAACPLWPLFTALSRPLAPIRRRVSHQGRTEVEFDCYAVAWPVGVGDLDTDPAYHAFMLILPVASDQEERPGPVLPVGGTCRTCPRKSCSARREPSVLGEEF